MEDDSPETFAGYPVGDFLPEIPAPTPTYDPRMNPANDAPATVADLDHTEVAHARGYREGVRNERARWDAEREALVEIARAADMVANWDEPRIIPTEAIPDWGAALHALRAALSRLERP